MSKKQWETEWVDMPEFQQEKQRPFSKIIIRTASKEDLEELAKLLGQPLTEKTKSIWHPKLKRGVNAGKKYVSE